MCAISGIFNRSGNPVDESVFEDMLSCLHHRGPDGIGRFLSGGIGLGHRRLSIIDVSGGAQPITNESGDLHIVFNGEIYNFVELRKELESFGHKFKTRSDTEVILHAYEQWGTDSVRRLNGMFAFAIWNASRRELFIARDHLGIKPLYYFQTGKDFVFASEIKALLRHPSCAREVNLDSLADLFTFRYVPSPKTLIKGIYKLPPGHFLKISLSNLQIQRFWTWIPAPRTNWKESVAIEEYQSLLEDAVRLQMRSDVPLGLFLSSGVDSGVLLAIMRNYSSGPVQAFTIGFENGDQDNEITGAADIARMFGADHHTQMVSALDYSTYFERYMVDLEEPVGHESAAAFFFVSQLARKQVKVALTGQGADEPWAGYDRYLGVKLSGAYQKMPRFLTEKVAPLLAKLPGRLEKLKRGVTSLNEKDPLLRLTKIYSFFSADMKAQLFKGSLKAGFELDPFASRASLRSLHSDVRHLDSLTQMLYIDSRASLPDDLLMVGDKMSMANSLELRVPFLDYRIMEFVESLPPSYKLNGFTGKYLHKKAMIKWLPKKVVYRKKKGFSIPLGHWLRTSLRAFVEDALLSPGSAVSQYFDIAYISKILELDRTGWQNYTRQIYLLLSFELWHRCFLRPQTLASPSSDRRVAQLAQGTF